MIEVRNNISETSSENGKPSFQFNEYAVDWPLAGDVSALAGDIIEATLKALNERGDVAELEIGTDIRPRVLRIAEAFDWFKNNGYFSRSGEENAKVILTEKWKKLFLKVEPK